MIREFYDDTGDCQEMSFYKSDGSCKQYSIKKNKWGIRNNIKIP